MEDLVRLVESSRSEDAVGEIRQLLEAQFSESKDPWLVNFLYDKFVQSRSERIIQILVGVREPHDKFLLDRIHDGVKAGSSGREAAFSVLGFVVRKPPPWLQRVFQHSLLKEWIRVLKNEEDLIILLSALFDMVVMMPSLPAQVAGILQELFEVFSRLALWRYQFVKCLPEVQQVHVQVGLFAFFHRLYGMFPCNFLFYLRAHYQESNKDAQLVFVHTIRPMLNTVKMHPLLVTHGRDLERAASRWRGLEQHDVVVEASRYSILSQESAKEEHDPPVLEGVPMQEPPPGNVKMLISSSKPR